MYDVIMMWQSLHFILSLVVLDMHHSWWMVFGGLSSTFCSRVEQKMVKSFVGQNVNTNPKEIKKHTNPLLFLLGRLN